MPTNDAASEVPDGTTAGIPDGTPDDSSVAGGKQVAGDGGVTRRLARRSRTAAVVLAVVGAAVIVVALLLPSGIVTVTAALLGVCAVGVGAVIGTRATLWMGMTKVPVAVKGGATAVVGAATALSPVRPGAPVHRKLGAAVIPFRVLDGPQPGGGALLVHARADGVTLAPGDRIQVWRVTRSGPEPIPVSDSATVRGRFALRRELDGAVFLGTTKLTDVF